MNVQDSLPPRASRTAALPHGLVLPSLLRSPPGGRSLRWRLTLLVLGTMLPLIVFSAGIVYLSYEQDKAEANDRVRQVTRGVMAAVDRELQSLTAALEVLALSQPLERGDFETFRAHAVRFLERFPPGHNVVVADRNGQQLFNSSRPNGTVLPRRTDFSGVTRTFETRRPFISNIFLGALMQRPILSVDVPVIRNGEVLYNLSFNPPFEIFAEIIRGQSLPPEWVVAIMDRNGMHVARRPDLGGGTRASDSLRAELAQRDEGIAETTSVEGHVVLTAFTRSPTSGFITAVGIPASSLVESARRSLLLAVGIGGLLLILGLIFAIKLAKDLARAEAHRELLFNELNHRVKNTLSTVQALAVRTLRDAADPAQARRAIEARLVALSRAHNILGERSWEGAELRQLLLGVVEPIAGDRLVLSGPTLRLSSQPALALAMVFNELATNAAKYGALSKADGVVKASWDIANAEAGDRRVQFRWQELDGPLVHTPERESFGLALIKRSVERDLDGKLEIGFEPHGLSCTIIFPLHD